MDDKILDHFKKDKYAESLGISIEKVEEGYAEVTMSVNENMVNFHGTANGGAIFSLADAAFAYASNSYGQTAVGLTITMNYMQAGVVNEKLKAVAKEDNKSNRIGLYRIEVLNQKDELIALAEGMVYRKKEMFIN
jgi:acyl-CoA thioesterase